MTCLLTLEQFDDWWLKVHWAGNYFEINNSEYLYVHRGKGEDRHMYWAIHLLNDARKTIWAIIYTMDEHEKGMEYVGQARIDHGTFSTFGDMSRVIADVTVFKMKYKP